MTRDGFSRPRAKKLGGRPKGSLGATAVAIREAVQALRKRQRVMTVRGIFYALTVAGVVEKTEAGYDQVQRQVLLMRRDGVLPWSFVADATRWMRKPESWDDADDILAVVARAYRRNLWQRQKIRLEVWLEKDALASIVSDVTEKWDVALMVSRGQSSDTFCYFAAQTAREARRHGITTHILALYDADRSGRSAAAKVREKLVTYSDGAPIEFRLLAVTDEQIDEWELPTRPGKENPSERAVELDAIPPDKLIALVSDAISGLVDQRAWEIEQAYEESERAILAAIVDGARDEFDALSRESE